MVTCASLIRFVEHWFMFMTSRSMAIIKCSWGTHLNRRSAPSTFERVKMLRCWFRIRWLSLSHAYAPTCHKLLLVSRQLFSRSDGSFWSARLTAKSSMNLQQAISRCWYFDLLVWQMSGNSAGRSHLLLRVCASLSPRLLSCSNVWNTFVI